MENDQENKNPKINKGAVNYYLFVMLIILILNWVLIPMFTEASIIQTTYSEFINMVESGDVSVVQIQDNQIVFVAKGDNQLALAKLIRQV